MLSPIPKLENAEMLILCNTMSCYYIQMILCDAIMLK